MRPAETKLGVGCWGMDLRARAMRTSGASLALAIAQALRQVLNIPNRKAEPTSPGYLRSGCLREKWSGRKSASGSSDGGVETHGTRQNRTRMRAPMQRTSPVTGDNLDWAHPVPLITAWVSSTT